MKKKFYHKTKVFLSTESMTIPNQTTPLKILLVKFAAGLPIGDGTQTMPSYEYDISDCIVDGKEDPNKFMSKLDEYESRGSHHADEIDIVVTENIISDAKQRAVHDLMKKTRDKLTKSELKRQHNFQKSILNSVTSKQ